MRRMKAENDKGCADGRRQGRGRTAKSCKKKERKKSYNSKKMERKSQRRCCTTAINQSVFYFRSVHIEVILHTHTHAHTHTKQTTHTHTHKSILAYLQDYEQSI